MRKGDQIPKASANAANISSKVERVLRQQYSQIPADENEKILDGIQKFIALSYQPPVILHRIIHEAAMAIYRLFPFKEITIGLKSPVDGRYRYEEVIGHSRVAAEALRKLSYTYDEFFSQRDYPAIRVSKYTELALVEELPYLESEKDTYNRPTLLSEVRRSIDDFVEGDYLDVYMYGPKDEMIGWIELGATKDGKMPSASVIKRLELFASILSCVIQRVMAAKNE